MPPLAESGMLRMSLADAGSVNFGTYDSNGLPMGNFVYRNSFDDVHHMFESATATRSGRAWRCSTPASCGRSSPGTTPVGCPPGPW